MSSSKGSPQPRSRTGVSWIAGGFFTSWAPREAQRPASVAYYKSVLPLYLCPSYSSHPQNNPAADPSSLLLPSALLSHDMFSLTLRSPHRGSPLLDSGDTLCLLWPLVPWFPVPWEAFSLGCWLLKGWDPISFIFAFPALVQDLAPTCTIF